MSENSPSEDLVGMEKEEESYFFANKIGRLVFLGLEESAGSESMRAILTAARLQDRLDHYPPNNFAPEFPFEELGRIQVAVEELYGPRAGRRLARQIGAVCFRRGVEDLRPILGIGDLILRVLPLRMRFRVTFEVLAQIFNRFSDHQVELEEDEEYFHWVSKRCGVCWERDTDTPCCDLMIGLLEEGLYWLSGGEKFFIEESSCMATGDPSCVVLIGKRPLVADHSTED